jgi:hypothetical protein
MKKIIVRIVTVIVVLIVLGLVVVFFSLNSIVKKGVDTIGPKLTQTDVTLGAAEISPFSGGGRLTKLFVGNPKDYKSASAFQLGDIKVSVVLGSVMSDTIVVNELNIQSAEVTLEGTLSKNNLTEIMNNIDSANSNPEASSTTSPNKPAKKFIVKDLVVDGTKANLVLNLPVIGSKTLSITVPPIHLQNIGQAEGGVTAAQLVQAIMKPLLADITKSAMEEVTKLTGSVQDLGKKGAAQLEEGKKKLSNLFK